MHTPFPLQMVSLGSSFDGSYIVAGSDRVYLFSRSSSTPLWSYQTDGWVPSVSISFDGSYIAAGSADGKVYLFSRSSSTPLWSYQTDGWVPSVSISFDGSYIAAGSADGKVYLFSRSSSTPLWSYQTGNWVYSVFISSDGSHVAAGNLDYRVYLFSKNHPPALSSGSVSPSAGTTRDTFTYEVTYSDPDGDPPAYVRVCIDGTAHAMTYVSGTYSGGALYRYQATLPAGSHTYYFEASDGEVSVRLPPTGTYSGPSVQLKRAPGRGLLPLILILVVVGAAVAGTVAWRRGLLRRPAGAKPPGKPKGPFCPHYKLKLPPDAQFCPECGKKVK
jgi:WD40 repeat protein